MPFVKRIGGAAALGALLTAGTLAGAHATAIYTAIDLNPSGFTSSQAFGVADGQQVGFASGPATGGAQAILWTGTAASAVNLNPSGLGLPLSTAWGAANGQQVGYAFHSNDNHAILWTGTAASAVDLTPSGFIQAGFFGTADGQQVGLEFSPPTWATPFSGRAPRPAPWT
jgi:hypothetical protein